MHFLCGVSRVFNARHHQAIIRRDAVVIDHRQLTPGYRRHALDEEHVVVVVVVDAGVVHDAQIGIGNHVAVSIQRPEHAHRVATLDALGIRWRRTATLGVQRWIGG